MGCIQATVECLREAFSATVESLHTPLRVDVQSLGEHIHTIVSSQTAPLLAVVKDPQPHLQVQCSLVCDLGDKFIEVIPDIIWLSMEEGFDTEVYVTSNTDWQIQ